jgi:hypothetical protein
MLIGCCLLLSHRVSALGEGVLDMSTAGGGQMLVLFQGLKKYLVTMDDMFGMGELVD